MDVHEAIGEMRTIAHELRTELRSLERRVNHAGQRAATLDRLLTETDTTLERMDTDHEYDQAHELELR